MDRYDVIVLGAGAAGMIAAIRASAEGASVGLFEKGDSVGGTAAWSGGIVWLPNNAGMAALDISDSKEEVLTYLRSLSLGMIDEHAAETFIDTVPVMEEWLAANTPVVFQVLAGFPDYHPENPGGKPRGGRSVECPLFSFQELGDWAARVTVGPQMPGPMTIAETPLGRAAPGGVPAEEMARRRERDERGAGQALAGRLLKGCLDRGVEPRTGLRATNLIVDDGRVVGVRFESANGPVEVAANRGVIIATGGFEWDENLVRSFLRGPIDVPATPPTNTGDGLRMAMRVGADLANMREAWWAPTIRVEVPARGEVSWLVNGERTRPRSIIVNGAGTRFANESVNYNSFGAAFHVIDVTSFQYANRPAWLIFDDLYLKTYGLAVHRPGQPVPSWITQAPTVAELAAAIDVPVDALEATVARWNKHVADGNDADFGRGGSMVDKWWGDARFGETPEATLGPLDAAPYYAVQVFTSTLGTKGGPRTNDNGQVLDIDGGVIPGLYAAGNAMAVTAMGATYGGAGGTLAPALVWGFLAGAHAAHAPAHLPAGTPRTAG